MAAINKALAPDFVCNCKYPAIGSAFTFIVLLLLAGCSGGGAPESPGTGAPRVFTVAPSTVTAGSSVKLSAEVAGATPMTYAWKLGGGLAPASSTDSGPTIHFENLGTYSCELTVTNSAGSDTHAFDIVVRGVDVSGRVLSLMGNAFPGVTISLGEGLETTTDEDGNWVLHNVKPGNYYIEPSLGDSRFEPRRRLAEVEAGGLGGQWFNQSGMANTQAEWLNTWVYGSYNTDSAHSAATDRAGSLYLTMLDSYILKYSAAGALEWARSWRLDDQEAGGAVIGVDSSGNLLLAGRSYYEDEHHLLLAKLNNRGYLIWQKLSEDASSLSVNAMVAADGGAMVLAGGGRSDFGETDGCLTALLNNDGSLAWATVWGNDYYDQAADVVRSADGSIYVTGSTAEYSHFGDDGSYYEGNRAFLLKYNQLGKLIWQRIWDRDYATSATSVDISADGSIYVAASSEDDHLSYANQNDMLLKFNADGDLIWSRTVMNSPAADYYSPELQFEPSLCCLADGSLCYADSLADDRNPQDLILLHLSSAGKALGQSSYVGPDSQGNPVLLTADGSSVFIAGSADSPSGYWVSSDFSTVLLEGRLTIPTRPSRPATLEMEPALGHMQDETGQPYTTDGYYNGVFAMRTAVP